MARRGDGPQPAPAGLVRFWDELHPTLIGGLSLHTGNRAVAEELAQETLIRVWARWPEVTLMSSPTAWTWRVALNLARSRFRTLAAERRALDKVDRDTIVEHDPAAAVAVRRAVAALPERQRRALVLRYWADLPVGEVARIMRCSPGTVKAHTHRAMLRLRDEFDVELPTDPDVDPRDPTPGPGGHGSEDGRDDGTDEEEVADRA